MKPQVLLLGHTGFIGSRIFQILQDKKIPTQGISTEDVNLLSPKSINYLSKKLTKNTIIIITTAVNRELGDNLKTFQDNIKMITHISLALESTNIKRCIYLSTADVYGITRKLPITEETPVAPQTYYATAKYTCEQLLQITCKKTNVPLLVLRYNGIFGPGQKNIGYGPNYFVKSIVESRVVKLWGDGKELRDSVYVKDLAKIITRLSFAKNSGVYNSLKKTPPSGGDELRSLKMLAEGEKFHRTTGLPVVIYNIAKGKSYSFMHTLKIAEELSGESIKIEHRKRTSPPFNQIFDIKKLRSAIPKFSFTPMENALKETYDNFKLG